MLVAYRTHNSQLFTVTTIQPVWLSTVLDNYASDPSVQALLQQLAMDPSASGPYSLSQGIIRFHGRILIGEVPALQKQLISAFHDSPQGGHSGFPMTYRRLNSLF